MPETPTSPAKVIGVNNAVDRPMGMSVVRSGIGYFLVIFFFAFVLGVARSLWIAPRIGAAIAIGLELPVVLFASWCVARRVAADRSFTSRHLLLVGVIAFVLTMASEVALAGTLRAESMAQWGMSLVTPVGLLGLAGQLGFALMSAFCRWTMSEQRQR